MPRDVLKKLSLLAALAATGLVHAADVPASQPGLVMMDSIDVRHNSAIGDGQHDDTAAIQHCIDACPIGGEVLLPKGEYLSGSLRLHGNMTFDLGAGATLVMSPDPQKYPIAQVRFEGRFIDGHQALLHAENAQHLSIVGSGKLQGPISIGNLRHPRGPALIELTECSDVVLDGFSTQYARMWSIHLLFCHNVLVHGLTERSQLNRANGDGIDVDSCDHLHITHCDMATGDDCISLKSGRGMEAVKIGRPTEYVQIDHCHFVSGFAGIGIGTELSGGIAHVQISDCDFARSVNGIFIKSKTDRGAYVDDIVGENLTATCSAFLRIDLLTKGIADSLPVEGPAGLTAVSNLKFEHIKVNVEDVLDTVTVSPQKPVVGLTLSDVTGTSEDPLTLENMQKVSLADLRINGVKGPLILVHNVSGTGLQGAGPLPPRPTTRASTRRRGDATTRDQE